MVPAGVIIMGKILSDCFMASTTRHISRQTGLRTECVHLLSQGCAGNHFHAEGIGTGFHELVDQSFFIKGIKVADMNRTFL